MSAATAAGAGRPWRARSAGKETKGRAAAAGGGSGSAGRTCWDEKLQGLSQPPHQQRVSRERGLHGYQSDLRWERGQRQAARAARKGAADRLLSKPQWPGCPQTQERAWRGHVLAAAAHLCQRTPSCSSLGAPVVCRQLFKEVAARACRDRTSTATPHPPPPHGRPPPSHQAPPSPPPHFCIGTGLCCLAASSAVLLHG